MYVYQAELLLQFFVGIVDTKLLETVHFKRFKPEKKFDIQLLLYKRPVCVSSILAMLLEYVVDIYSAKVITKDLWEDTEHIT